MGEGALSFLAFGFCSRAPLPPFRSFCPVLSNVRAPAFAVGTFLSFPVTVCAARPEWSGYAPGFCRRQSAARSIRCAPVLPLPAVAFGSENTVAKIPRPAATGAAG
jgi:hypothetical protein